MKQRSTLPYPPSAIDEAMETIFAQQGLLLCIRRTAWWLFQHEMKRTDPATGRMYTPWKALDNTLKWMAEQCQMLERVKQEPTQMQRRLLQMLADGKSQKQIALELGVDARSVRVRFAKLRSRMGAESL